MKKKRGAWLDAVRGKIRLSGAREGDFGEPRERASGKQPQGSLKLPTRGTDQERPKGLSLTYRGWGS